MLFLFRRSRWLAVAALLSACTPPATEPEAGPQTSALFTNGGFESGAFGSWTKSTFLNNTGLLAVPPTTTAQLQLAAGGTDFTFALTNGVPQSQLPSAGPLPHADPGQPAPGSPCGRASA